MVTAESKFDEVIFMATTESKLNEVIFTPTAESQLDEVYLRTSFASCLLAVIMVLKSQPFVLSYDEARGFYLCMPIGKLVILTSIFPFIGFVFCVIWSLTYHFEATTLTHCKVWNCLPSLSAAIGYYRTQYILWCICVSLHAPPRFLFTFIYYRCYMKTLKQWKLRCLAKIACLLSLVEIISLMGLSYFTSSASYDYHKKFFLMFMASSELYMLLKCLLMTYMKKNINNSQVNDFSLRMKMRLLIINAVAFAAAGYFFIRHNTYCEPGIYSLFAFFEYIVVLSNTGFHLTAVIDLGGEFITIHRRGIDVR